MFSRLAKISLPELAALLVLIPSAMVTLALMFYYLKNRKDV